MHVTLSLPTVLSFVVKIFSHGDQKLIFRELLSNVFFGTFKVIHIAFSTVHHTRVFLFVVRIFSCGKQFYGTTMSQTKK